MRMSIGAAMCALVVVSVSVLAQQAAPAGGKRYVTRAGPLIRTDRGAIVWSPRGDSAAYIESTRVSTESQRHEIQVIDLAHLTVSRATGDLQGTDPTWSPDGLHLAYTEEDAATPGLGDIVISTLGGIAQRRVTQGGGFFSPFWLHDDTDRFLACRETRGDTGLERTICLINPAITEWPKGVVTLARWRATVDGLPGVVAFSPSGRYALAAGNLNVEVDGRQRRELRLALLDLKPSDRWANAPVAPAYVEPPGGADWVDHVRWADDDRRAIMAAGSNDVAIWMLDASKGRVDRVLASPSDGQYEYAEWADGGTALLALFAPRPGDRARSPELHLFPLGADRPTILDPDWGGTLVLDRHAEVAGDPSGTRFIVGGGNELRFLELGTEVEASMVRSRSNMRIIAEALLEFARSRPWGVGADGKPTPMLPDPTNAGFRKAFPGVKADRPDFWVDLVRDILIERVGKDRWESLLKAPADTDRQARTSYIIPEEAYGLHVPYVIARGDTVILRERSGVHPGGYHVLRLGRQAEWVAEPAPAAPHQ